MRVIPALLLLLSATLAPAADNPFAKDPKAAEAGRGIFRIYCGPCHGIRAEGGRGPDLTIGTYSAGNQDSDLAHVISEGVPGTEMPSYSVSLGSDNIWRVVTYIRSLEKRQQAALKGDRGSGEKLFWAKGGCGGCHRVGQRGGRMGPELTDIGRKRSLAHLRDSLLKPDADIAPGYYVVTVETSDGKKIQGVQRSFDTFSAQLMDASETIHSFERDRVKSMKREFRSMMPAYGASLSAGELDDMLAYLTSLRGTENRR